ncbi:12-oxophytodienoate reductase 2 [Sesamum alatum]|uniref:12-oxophytodienoate reductase 2 n=1 Tax=Sesamum alatum TaxID=300844 RepID=A0AAE2C8Z2_9LAMI|nr:12-oxophytodienoate reductase 2 [Sesamum alatum]
MVECDFKLQTPNYHPASKCKVEAISSEIGGDRVGIRLSPFSNYMEAGEPEPKALGLYMAEALNKYGILYCHMAKPRVYNYEETPEAHSLKPMRMALRGTFIVNGDYGRKDGNMRIMLIL